MSIAGLKPVEDNKNTNEEDICIIFNQGCTRYYVKAVWVWMTIHIHKTE